MLLFEKIRWCNFLSTGNQWTEIELNKHNTTLIVGKNGAGKSTLLDAITYALFGKPFRKINKPQLHNSITRKGLLVELTAQINGIPYLIRRGDRPGIFEVYQNGKLLNQNSKNTDYQDVLEKQIIKCTMKSFCQIVILGSATYQPFMGLPTGNRREIIEDLLGLEIFTIMNKLQVQRLNDNSAGITEAEMGKRLLVQEKTLLTNHLEEFTQMNEKMIAEKQSKIDSSRQLIDDLKDEIRNLIGEKHVHLPELEKEDALIKRRRKLDEFRTQINQKIYNHKSNSDFFCDNQNCPTCKQEIDQEFKDSMIDQNNQKINELEEGIKKLFEEQESIMEKLKHLDELKSVCIDLENKIYKSKHQISSNQKYIDELEDEIEKLKNAKSKSVDSVRISKIDDELLAKDVELTKLHENKQLLIAASSLLKDTGIKSKMIKKYIPIINKLINKYLAIMDFFVDFQLNESFVETIKSRHRDEFSYASFSEGEKMKINLAILFTWRAVSKMRNSINTNLLIMDEVLDGSIDTDAKDAFFQILSTMQGTNVFVISHAGDTLTDKFSNTIKFAKERNFSRIV